MEELTKLVLKMGETLNKVLENQEYMRNDILKMQKDISKMQNEIEGIKGEIEGIKERIDKIELKIDDGFVTTMELIRIANDRLETLEHACNIKPKTKISL